MTKEGLLKLLDSRKAKAGTWAKLAASLGISPQYLNDVKEGRREPGPKLLEALGKQAVTEYYDLDSTTRNPARLQAGPSA